MVNLSRHKGSVHGLSVSHKTGKEKDWPLHYTMDLKETTLEQQHKHYTVHANTIPDVQDSRNPKSWVAMEAKPISERGGETLLLLPDEYVNKEDEE